jgi:hypothetical protein
MTKPARVCILYGLAEGQKTGQLFEKTLSSAGFSISRDAKDADIVVTHSGGCFLLPASTSARLIILIGVPFWPGKAILTAMHQKTLQEFGLRKAEKQLGKWLERMKLHLWYLCNLPIAVKLWRGRHLGNVWSVSNRRLVLVRNHDDVYCTPELGSLPFKKAPEIVELPGQHDDCWDNPAPYIRILEQYYG